MKAYSMDHTFNNIMVLVQLYRRAIPLSQYMWLCLHTYVWYSYSITLGLPYIQPTEACVRQLSATLHMAGIST